MCATRARELDAVPPAELALRNMERRDLDQVAAIERLSFSCPWSRESFRRLLDRADADLCVAELRGAVAGYAVLWYAGDEAELGNLAVEERHRRCGVGGRLLDWAIERARARGSRRFFLEVRASNRDAQALYRSRGFFVAGVRARYYRRPVEDAQVMCLHLTPPGRQAGCAPRGPGGSLTTL